MNLSTDSNPRTGRFVIKDTTGRVVFETYRLNAEERTLLSVVLTQACEAAFEDGRKVGAKLEKPT